MAEPQFVGPDVTPHPDMDAAAAREAKMAEEAASFAGAEGMGRGKIMYFLLGIGLIGAAITWNYYVLIGKQSIPWELRIAAVG